MALEVDFYEGDNIKFIDTFSNAKAFKSYLRDLLFEKVPKLSHPNPFYTSSQAESLFKGSNGYYLLDQLNHSDGSIIDFFPEQKTSLLLKQNSNNLNNDFENKSSKQIRISKPVISKSGKLALIWYNTLFVGDGHTGIHLFEKIDGKWLLLKTREFY
ncbi:hypothetical protein [Leeuwenhoekiella parthenopeia]|uniref:Nuclear transport factor 2 family protein n=1 Tax=Leeuwenhoekiella parthenopeia TaxID=2890320 RepID=A0ABS8GR09_9FLAO|nr:hypothetical protein [Leeuwenhoekiella parthenopeia]MCC4212412.1 hypothetical protein [Leeuwenhoekiella parthenopeia]